MIEHSVTFLFQQYLLKQSILTPSTTGVLFPEQSVWQESAKWNEVFLSPLNTSNQTQIISNFGGVIEQKSDDISGDAEVNAISEALSQDLTKIMISEIKGDMLSSRNASAIGARAMLKGSIQHADTRRGNRLRPIPLPSKHFKSKAPSSRPNVISLLRK